MGFVFTGGVYGQFLFFNQFVHGIVGGGAIAVVWPGFLQSVAGEFTAKSLCSMGVWFISVSNCRFVLRHGELCGCVVDAGKVSGIIADCGFSAVF